MTAFDRREVETDAVAALAEGFAAAVRAWSMRLVGDAARAQAAAAAAAALCRATTDGHVCVVLDELPAGPGLPSGAAAWRAALLDGGCTGTPADPGSRPLLLDDEGRLYLQRGFDDERRLAERLVRAARAPAQPVDAPTRTLLDQLFAGGEHADGRPDRQKLAAAAALRGRLAVISGGPGTGKTTMVVNLLACLRARDPGCRIALAAPTGKAAARLADAIRRRAATLPPSLREGLPTEATTIHRLLGAGPNGFAHDAARPLAIDVLVVDEASMLDLALAARLLDAVPPAARIVLLGDKDQLAAVESGAVLAEIGADARKSDDARAALAALCGVEPGAIADPAPSAATPIADAVVWFDRNYRFPAGSGIGRLASAVNAGAAAEALDALRTGGGDGALRRIDDAGARPGEALRDAAAAGYEPYFDAVSRAPRDVAGAFAAFDRFRVLCALREGPRGVAGFNAGLGALARARLDPAAPARSPWFVGRPVIVTRNDAVLGLFNGDIGLALPDADGALKVHFAAPGGGLRALAPARLPAHDDAFALTVHKAQGSEFDAVLVVLPARAGPLVSRELVYTALTRARARVALAGSDEVLAAALRTPTRRRGGLVARLREAAAAIASDARIEVP